MTKKQKRSLLILIGILVVLAAGLLAVRAHNKAAEKKAAAADAASSESSLTGADLKFSAISYTNSNATLSFARDKDGNWYWTGDPEFPLDSDYLTKLSNTLSGLTPQQTITKGDTLDAYGLSTPAVTLTATETDGTALKLALGKAIDCPIHLERIQRRQIPIELGAIAHYQRDLTQIFPGAFVGLAAQHRQFAGSWM